jgi:hypothetical protein
MERSRQLLSAGVSRRGERLRGLEDIFELIIPRGVIRVRFVEHYCRTSEDEDVSYLGGREDVWVTAVSAPIAITDFALAQACGYSGLRDVRLSSDDERHLLVLYSYTRFLVA